MDKKVYFFGYYLGKFYLPRELDDTIFCPSVFAIEDFKTQPNELLFKVVENGEVKNLSCNIKDNLLFVETNKGIFNFTLNKTNIHYGGENSFFKTRKFILLKAIQYQKLEELSKKGFYFVGE